MAVNSQTLAEIQKKALAGIPLVKPTAEKSALYNSFLATSQKQASPNTPNQQTNTNANTMLNAIKPPGNPSPSVMSGPVVNNNPNHNSNQSRPDFLGMTPDMISQMFSGMQSGAGQYYDPSKDPVYQSMLELSTKQADKAGLSAMESMNDRGILNSTVTADRVGQIKQGASDAVLAAIPGLAGNFDNKQMANSQSMQNLLNSVLGAGQFQQTFAEDNRRFDKNFTLDEAKVSGRYIPEEAQSAINTILEAKEASAKGGITPEQRAANNQRATEARRLLATLGVDISGLDTNVGYNDALKNSYYLGRDSLPQQEMDLARTEVMGSQQSTSAQGLIDQILRSKQSSAQGGLTAEQRSYNAQTATNARNQLAALGYDVSGLAGNIGYDQALKNSQSLGQPTQKAKSDAANLQLDRDKLAFEKSAFGREMDYKEQSALIDADLKARGLDLEEIRLNIQQFSADSDAEYRQFQIDSGISEQNASKNTNAAIGEVMKTSSAAEALEFLADSASNWARQGVDVRAVLKAVEQRFPGTEEAVTGGDGRGYGLP